MCYYLFEETQRKVLLPQESENGKMLGGEIVFSLYSYGLLYLLK